MADSGTESAGGSANHGHVPVLLDRCVELLAPALTRTAPDGSGAVLVEIVFSWPGLGSLTVEAIQRRDYPLLQGCVLVVSVSYVLVNSATDLLYAWLDPRIRLTGA